MVAQSAISRHVGVLEKFLGLPLFERRHQQLVLTEAGRHLLPVVTRSFDRLDGALGDIIQERGAPRRMLRVALPPTFAAQLAIPILRDFRSAFPELAIEIASRSAADGDAEAGLSVVYSEPKVTDAINDLLWMERLTVLCSPAALGDGPADLPSLLARQDPLHVRLGGRAHQHMWELMARAFGRPDLDVDRGLVFDTAHLAAQYALSGDGLALVDPMLFRDDLAAGRLVAPLDVRLASGYGYYLVTAPEDLDEAVVLFRSWLIRRFATRGGEEGRGDEAP
jgi:DNA-binding transcriptional LysR family regulator